MPMTKTEQRQFVRELTNEIAQDVIRKIQKGRIPAEWDGIELRQMLADKFAASCARMFGQRKRDFENAFLLDPNL